MTVLDQERTRKWSVTALVWSSITIKALQALKLFVIETTKFQ